MDFDTALHYYTIKEDFFLPIFNFDLYIYFLSLVNAIGKGVILAQIFALGYVYAAYLAQTQADDIIHYLENWRTLKSTLCSPLGFGYCNQVKISVSLYPVPVSVGKPELCGEPGLGRATGQLWQEPSQSWYRCHPALSPPPLRHPWSEGSRTSCPSPEDARGKGTLAQ